MAKTIIVTGGAGFIGSHICERLLKEENTVICLDNLLTGSLKNINHLMTNKRFFYFEHDVCEPFRSKKFSKVDEIFHFASPADPNIHSEFSYMAHPFETMKVNTIGTWNMCELAVRHGALFSFASTSEIYGDPQISPQSEDYRGNVSTTGPRSVYDEAKRFGETIVAAFIREKQLDGRITRIFNTYGPQMNINEGRAVVQFIKQAIANQPITVYGDGKQTRSFCYIDDQVEGQLLAMRSEGTTGEVFNIGNDEEYTIIDFAQLIKRLTASSSPVVFEDLPEDDPHQRRPDISKSKKILGWEPRISAEDGLKKTIDYFLKHDD